LYLSLYRKIFGIPKNWKSMKFGIPKFID